MSKSGCCIKQKNHGFCETEHESGCDQYTNIVAHNRENRNLLWKKPIISISCSERNLKGGYTAVVLSLPGCVTCGETIDEAIVMTKEAVALYIESLIEQNETIPSEEEVFE